MIRSRALLQIQPILNRVALRIQSSTVTNDTDSPLFDMENPFEKEHEKCILCKHNVKVDYKNVKLLSQFQSPYTGRIYGRHITHLCKRQQELVQAEIFKAQTSGLMASYLKEPCYLDDPNLFDPEKPIRPHRF
ncbi:small ribosomal subunit protein bS18m [Euwallacea fornicatus]|uniref:small ribosomal subunit protein bS18m n=1 Tax=Euwallacea fornicatus TaxID=995702 RepID=UPI00338F41C5